MDRCVWGFPYAIYNYSCYEGELSMYILCSLVVFLSTFWSIEILGRVKHFLNSVYRLHKPAWVRIYSAVVVYISNNPYARVLHHGSVFVLVLVLPLLSRYPLPNSHKH